MVGQYYIYNESTGKFAGLEGLAGGVYPGGETFYLNEAWKCSPHNAEAVFEFHQKRYPKAEGWKLLLVID